MASLKEALAHGRALHKTAAFRVQAPQGLEVMEADAGCTPYEFWWREPKPGEAIPEDEWELREEGEWMGDEE